MKLFFMILLPILVFSLLANAEDDYKKVMQFDLGVSKLHYSQFDGASFSIHFFHRLKQDNSFMLDFSIIYGTADIGYFGFIIGVKYRSRNEKKLSPFIYGAGGAYTEKYYTGWVLIGAIGIDINISKRIIIPFALQFGKHSFGELRLFNGPDIISVGLGYRF